jgi:hypothetical protein
MASLNSSEIRASIVISVVIPVFICGRKIGNNIIHLTLHIECGKRMFLVDK